MASTLSRRNVAALVAIVLLAVLFVVALQRPVGYTLYSPGPTVNVLGTSAGKQIIEVSGHPAYRDDGGLRLVTVFETAYDNKVSLVEALRGWIDPDVDVYPHDAVYPRDTTQKAVRQQSAAEMASSQDNAVAAALRALGISYTSAVKDQPPGSRVDVGIVRAGAPRTVTITTAALGTSGKQREQSRVGVQIGPSYRFPFDVNVNLADNIGGPSAGLMFSLGIYDVLTPGSLTRGRVIAGTGTIDAHGKVGEIGGVQQKIVGAQDDGARLFLVPAGNCAEALGAHYDADRIRLVRVTTMSDALSSIKAWAADPDADLPRCTA